MKKLLFLILFFSGHLTAQTVSFDPELNWRELRSEHFKVIFAQPQRVIAQEFANAAEQAYQVLLPLFKEAPRLPITIVVSDNTDLSNGYATFFPYDHIVVYPVLPNSLETLADFENWVYELILHELAHLFNFQPAHGFYTPLKYIFGSVITPTAILPRWYLEGLAVETESRYTLLGRLRSFASSATLRALALEGDLQNLFIDKINESTSPYWPYGQNPYLFGSLLWHQIVEQTGEASIYTLNQRYGRRFPFLLHQPLRDLMGKDFLELWRETQKRVNEEALAQGATINASGKENMQALNLRNEYEQLFPAISPNQLHLAYIAANPYSGAKVVILTRENLQQSWSEAKEVATLQTKATTRLAWHPDNKRIFLDRLNFVGRYKTFRDLYEWNFTSDQARRLTNGIRVMEPAVSPQGNHIVFIRYHLGRHYLYQFTLKTKKLSLLHQAQNTETLGSPEFLDEQTVIFSIRSEKIPSHFVKLQLKSKTEFLNESTGVKAARRTPQGMLFVSNQTGVGNAYFLAKEKNIPMAITNTTTAIFNADVDTGRQEVVASRLTGKGNRLYTYPLSESNPPRVPVLPIMAFNKPHRSEVTVLNKTATTEEDYSPGSYLYPRYWIPVIYPVEGGVLLLGSTEINDPLRRHVVTLEGAHDSVTAKNSYGVGYQNSTTPLTIQAAVSEHNELIASSAPTVTHRSYSLGSSSFIGGLSNSWRLGLNSAMLESTSSNGRNLKRLGVGAELSYNSESADVIKYDNLPQVASVLGYRSYISGEDRITYDRINALLAHKWHGFLPSRHYINTQIKYATAPQLSINNSVYLGERTIGGNYLFSLYNSSYLLRGYPSGALVGRTLGNANLEYRFPLADLQRGFDTFPLFLRNLEMAVFYDLAFVDGAYYSPKREIFVRTRSNEIYSGTGVEFNLQTTAAYHAPLYFILGLYYGFSEEAGGDFTTFLGIGYSGHGGLNHKLSREAVAP